MRAALALGVVVLGCGGGGGGTATTSGASAAAPVATSDPRVTPGAPGTEAYPDGGVYVLRDGGTYRCPRPEADGRIRYDRCVPGEAPPTASRLFVLPPEVLGPLPRDEVKMLLNEAMPRVAACFEKVIVAEPGIVGLYRVEMTIDAEGEIERSFTESALGEHDVKSCLTPVLREWRFLPAGGRSRVNLRFELRPPGAGLHDG